MRSFIIITVLSALAACYAASVVPSEEEMVIVVYDENFPNGTIVTKAELDSRFNSGVVIASWMANAPAIARQSQVTTLQYFGDEVVRRIVYYNWGNPSMTYTPLLSNNMQITITTRIGVELRSTVELQL